jgi:hypothetical protein
MGKKKVKMKEGALSLHFHPVQTKTDLFSLLELEHKSPERGLQLYPFFHIDAHQ